MALASFADPCNAKSRMPKRTGRKLDVVQNARRVVDESLRRFEATQPTQKTNPSLISQVMAEMGRKGGKIGGKNRMENLGATGPSDLGHTAPTAPWPQNL